MVDWNDGDWRRVVRQLRSGDCTPFLGAGASSPPLPVGSTLSRKWAAEFGYPFEDPNELQNVMQYATFMMREAVAVKDQLAAELADFAVPDHADPHEPHGLLADLPIKSYFTTNYDSFMASALERVGKTPNVAICPWFDGAEEYELGRIDEDPTEAKPIVYHLHGSLRVPASLVVTADDYEEFLATVVMERGMDQQRLIPYRLLPALTRRPLLFLGYSLRDVSFRTLFRSLTRTIPDVQRRRHVSVQLPPLPLQRDDEARRRAEVFLASYLDRQNISVYWGSAREFCAELRDRLEASEGA